MYFLWEDRHFTEILIVIPMSPRARPGTKPESRPHVRKTGRGGTKWETVSSFLRRWPLLTHRDGFLSGIHAPVPRSSRFTQRLEIQIFIEKAPFFVVAHLVFLNWLIKKSNNTGTWKQKHG